MATVAEALPANAIDEMLQEIAPADLDNEDIIQFKNYLQQKDARQLHSLEEDLRAAARVRGRKIILRERLLERLGTDWLRKQQVIVEGELATIEVAKDTVDFNVLELELMQTTGATGHADVAEAITGLLAEIGIKVNRAPRARSETRTREAAGQFQMWNHGYGQPALDPAGTFGTHYLEKSGRNFHSWANPRIEELYLQQLAMLDDNLRRPLIQEMTREAVQDSALNVLYWADEILAYWPYVKGVVVTPSRYTGASKLELLWLDR
ncbi:MAG: hypothetical protein IIB12_03690 [Chloroflexi bacterium]|nr:hypothetical protein [Chloroflexota bacterium]